MTDQATEPELDGADSDALKAQFREADNALVAALAKAQAEFPTIPKTKTGEVRGTTKDGKPYSYEYSYADLGDVLAAVRPILAANGLAVVQRTNVAGVLRTELRHTAGGMLTTEVELGQKSANPQAYGGALTYLRRYELATLLGIAPEEDTDARNVPIGNGRQAPAELPPWATMLSDDRVRAELAPLLTVLLGEERARPAYRAIKDTLGGAPAVLIPFARLLVAELVGAGVDGDVALSDRLERERESATAAQAKADAEEAQDAAEAPDPEPVDDPGPPSDAVRSAFANPEATAHIDAMAAEAREAGHPPARELTDEERAALRASAEEAAAAASGPDAQAPAGRVAPPDVSGLTGVQAVEALRGAGCICPEPLKATLDESARVDECPIMGHGIPF